MGMIFFSHVEKDKQIVIELAQELDNEDYSTWYYERDGIVGSSYLLNTGTAIDESDAVILIISPYSLESPNQVTKEVVRAHESRKPIFPLLIDIDHEEFKYRQPEWREALGATVAIQVDKNDISGVMPQILEGLKTKNIISGKNIKDIYISCSWRDHELMMMKKVCRSLIDSGFRLVGDSKDQEGFKDEKDRILSIMSSCGGFVAIVPDRGGGTTSSYILEEIRIAEGLSLTGFVVAEPAVPLDNIKKFTVVPMTPNEYPKQNKEYVNQLYSLIEKCKKPLLPHYVFFATDLDEKNKIRNVAVKKLVQKVTGMQCMLGEEIREKPVQEEIIKRIASSFVMIADISKGSGNEGESFNLNTCIEAGIARGAGILPHLISRGPRKSPPFIFRDQEVVFYEDEKTLMRLIESILRPYRRRILNSEI
jgi:hypothetical protein